MQFKKRLICSHVSLILSAGFLAATPGQQSHAQPGPVDCQPNTDATGWVCTPAAPDQSVPVSGNRFPGSDQNSIAGASAATANSATLASSTTSASRRQDELDWVSRAQLTPAERENLAVSCCGAFIEPPREDIDTEADPDGSDTVYRTVGGFQQFADNTIIISGQVNVQQGSRVITNDGQTTISGGQETVLMDGDIVLREPGLLLRGTSAYMDSSAGDSRIENAQYVLHDYGVHGNAESLFYTQETNFLTIENGEFSRCEPQSTFWVIRADSISIDQVNGRGYARGASLRIKDVPVFYYPFTLTFPLSDARVSGFLAPSAGSTRDGGLDIEVPYYFNLAPHYDATVSPRLISNRGVLFNGEARYLASWSMNTLNAALLANDKKFELDDNGVPLADSPPGKNRWFAGYEHIGAIGTRWTTLVDYNTVSDDDYFQDLGSSGLNVASRTHLNRQGRIDYRSDYLQAGVNVQRLQVLDPLFNNLSGFVDLNKPFDRLPQLQLATEWPLPAGLNVGLNAEYNAFDRTLDEQLLTPEQIMRGALVSGERTNLEPEIRWDIVAPGWFIKPAASYKYVSYKLDDQAQVTADDPDVGVAVYSLDSGLVFERPFSQPSRQLTQTLEPRLYYLNSDYEDQSLLPVFDSSEFSFSFDQLFRDDRFGGGDRIGDANQLAVALTSRVLDESGQERTRISLGQILYFEDRRVDLGNPLQEWIPRQPTTSDSSVFAGEFSYSFSDNWRVYSDILWDDENQEIDEGSFQFRYQSSGDLIFNLAYRYRDVLALPDYLVNTEIDPRIKQTDLSAVLPLNNNWRFLGRWNYDHSNSRNLETFAGVEYSNCCTTIRLVAREWVRQDELFLPEIDSNRGVFFQFTLHGLGDITGGGLSGLLSDSIAGFRDPTQP